MEFDSGKGVSELNQVHEIELSVVIPVKDEAENIDHLADELDDVLRVSSWNYEIVWVDDGSTDVTCEVLNRRSLHNSRHRVLHLAKNTGQSAAMWAGFQIARGAVIVTLDGDGQNDPRDIPQLAQQVIAGGVDMANGYRQERRDRFHRILASRIANGFRNWLTGRTVRDVGCSMRAFKRECVQNLPLFRGMHRFLPTLAAMNGYRLGEWPVNHRSRQKGKTKYTINNRLWVGLMDAFGVYWLQKRGFYQTLQNALPSENADSFGKRDGKVV